MVLRGNAVLANYTAPFLQPMAGVAILELGRNVVHGRLVQLKNLGAVLVKPTNAHAGASGYSALGSTDFATNELDESALAGTIRANK